VIALLRVILHIAIVGRVLLKPSRVIHKMHLLPRRDSLIVNLS